MSAEFLAALNDDLNTPKALATLFDLARQANTASDGHIALLDLMGLVGGRLVRVGQRGTRWHRCRRNRTTDRPVTTPPTRITPKPTGFVPGYFW